MSQGLQYYGISFGWIAWLLAAFGYAIGLKTRLLSADAARFIVSFPLKRSDYNEVVWLNRYLISLIRIKNPFISAGRLLCLMGYCIHKSS